jgi:ribosomal protein S18 acetylase RimI-like enzyme
MLDYTLVGTVATYRMPRPDDIPVLVDMVQRFHAETASGLPVDRAGVIATLRELDADRRAGSWFVFEKDEEVVGYCVLAGRLSNATGGRALHIDELYVRPGRRGRGIASDFLGLLAKVAPDGAAEISVEFPAGNRRARSLFGRLGYGESKTRTMRRPLRGA